MKPSKPQITIITIKAILLFALAISFASLYSQQTIEIENGTYQGFYNINDSINIHLDTLSEKQQKKHPNFVTLRSLTDDINSNEDTLKLRIIEIPTIVFLEKPDSLLSKINFNWANLLILLGGVQGVIFGFILIIIAIRDKKPQNHFLAILLIAFSFICGNAFLSDSGIMFIYSNLIFIPFSFLLLLGPAIYFYIQHTTNKEFTFKNKHLIFFLPALFEFGFYIVLFNLPVGNKQDFFTKHYHPIIWPIEQMLGIIYTLYFLLKSMSIILKYEFWVRENYSNVTGITLKWLSRLLLIYTFIWLLWTVISIVDFFIFNWQLDSSHYYPVYLLLSVFTFWIVASHILRKQKTPDFDVKDHRSQKQIDILDDETIDIIYSLKSKMSKDKLYLNPTLKLKELSESLNIPPHHLSNILNKGLGKTFFEFVNSYRIEEVKKRLIDKKYINLTILSIALDSGFNSKSTFNEIFKKYEGCTPNEYIKKHKIDSLKYQ